MLVWFSECGNVVAIACVIFRSTLCIATLLILPLEFDTYQCDPWRKGKEGKWDVWPFLYNISSVSLWSMSWNSLRSSYGTPYPTLHGSSYFCVPLLTTLRRLSTISWLSEVATPCNRTATNEKLRPWMQIEYRRKTDLLFFPCKESFPLDAPVHCINQWYWLWKILIIS